MAQRRDAIAVEAGRGRAHARGCLGLESLARTDDAWESTASARTGLARNPTSGICGGGRRGE
jgi:hypothetical protein